MNFYCFSYYFNSHWPVCERIIRHILRIHRIFVGFLLLAVVNAFTLHSIVFFYYVRAHMQLCTIFIQNNNNKINDNDSGDDNKTLGSAVISLVQERNAYTKTNARFSSVASAAGKPHVPYWTWTYQINAGGRRHSFNSRMWLMRVSSHLFMLLCGLDSITFSPAYLGIK